MTPQEKANKLISMNEIIVLAETGYKLPADERKGIAKRQAIETCNEILSTIVCTPTDYGASWTYWQQVKTKIEKL
jgi:hypothetical protein